MIRGVSQPSAILAAITPRSCSPHCMSQSVSILLQPQLHTNSLATSDTTRAKAAGVHSNQEAATHPTINPVCLTALHRAGLGVLGVLVVEFMESGERRATLHGILRQAPLALLRPHNDDPPARQKVRTDPH